MQRIFTPITLVVALLMFSLNINAQITPPHGTCGATAGSYVPPATADMDDDGYVMYADGSNMANYMQAATGGSLPDNSFAFDAINYEGGVPVDTTLVISDDYTVDLAALGLGAGDVLHAYTLTYDIATIDTIAQGVETNCATVELLTGNDQVCEILATIQANGGFQSLNDAVTLAELFFGEIPSVNNAAFQLDTLSQILTSFGPILGISQSLCFAYDGYTEIRVADAPPSCEATTIGISTTDATTVCSSDASAIVSVQTDGTEGAQQIQYIVTDETGTTILGLPPSNNVDFAGAPTGVCLIWAATHDGTFNAPTDLVADLEGCFALSNSIAVTRTNVTAATISTSGAVEATVCVDDETQSTITVDVADAGTQEVSYVVTDETGTTILGLPPTNVVGFNGVEPGVCLVWVVTHDGSLNAPTDLVADLEGCFALSNSIAVNRIECITACDLTLEVFEECDDVNGISTISFIVSGTGDEAYISGSNFNGTVSVGSLVQMGNVADGESYTIAVSTAEGEQVCDEFSATVSCVKIDECDLTISFEEFCDQTTGTSDVMFTVNGTGTTATMSGDFTGEVNIGDPYFLTGLGDGTSYSLAVSNGTEICDEISGTTNCVKVDECDLTISFEEFCDQTTGTSDVMFTVNGTGTTATMSGDFTGEVNIGDPYFLTGLGDGTSYSLAVSNGTEICDEISGTTNCVKVNDCDLSITLFEECDETTGVFTLSFIVNGTSAETATVSGSFDGVVTVGELVTVGNFANNETYSLEVSSNGEVCDSASGTVECVKATCDLTISLVEDCNENTGVFTLAFIVNGTSSETATVSGSFDGEVTVGELVTVGNFANNEPYNLSVSYNGDVCDSVSGTVDCVKAGSCESPITLVVDTICNDIQGEYTLLIIINGASGSYTLTGDISGSYESNSPITFGPVANAESTTFTVSDADPNSTCDPVTFSTAPECVKVTCDEPINYMVDTLCNTATGEYTLAIVINGGSGQYNMTGSLNMQEIMAGETIFTSPTADNETFLATISDADPESICDDVVIEITPNCVKAECEDPIVITYETNCVDGNEPFYTITFSVSGGVGVYDMSGCYTGVVMAGQSITTDPIEEGTSCTLIADDQDITQLCDSAIEEISHNVTCFVPGSIGDTVFFDENGNGIQDAGEPGIAGITVTLVGPDGTYTTTTDANGNYIFTGLNDGFYTVTVGNGPDFTELTTAGSFNINLGAGENYVDADFGFTPVCLPYEIDADVVCLGDNQPFYVVNFTITGACNVYNITSNYYNGTVLAGVTYTTNAIPDGVMYEILIENAEPNCSCDPVTITGVNDEPCYEPFVCGEFGVFTEQICPQPVDGTFDLQVFIFGGTEPYTLSGDYEGTIEGNSVLITNYQDESPYSFTITDAMGCDTLITGATESCVKEAIELLDFSGEARESENVLSWTTASEVDNDYFILERSNDGIDFATLSHIQGAGNSIVANLYSFIDEAPELISYYRLLTVDFDGKVEIASEIIKLERGATLTIDNVVIENNNVNVTLNSQVNEVAKLTIYDAAGRLIIDMASNVNVGTNNISINANSIADGMYLLNVQLGNEQTTYKFVK